MRHGLTCRRRSAQQGFTLIELVVALAVFSVAALALLRLEGATLRSTGILQDRLIGQIVARNIAIEAVTDPLPPSFGRAAGEEENAGRKWRWTRVTRRSGDQRIQQIDVAVIDDAGQPAGTLTVFRLNAA
jgi:general secretion pathway protein I